MKRKRKDVKRRPIQARAAEQGSLSPGGPYFHGGAPGLNPGDKLVSAKSLGITFNYLAMNAVYRRDRVYVTTSVHVATSFAARYIDQIGQVRPGWVYEVAPLRRVEVDQDYALFAGEFGMCESAKVVAVVEQDVVRSETEQLDLERPYLVWGARDQPRYDQHGLMIASPQMIANGVTAEWMSYLRPYLRATDVNARGRLSIVMRAAPEQQGQVFLTVLPSLDRDHQIVRGHAQVECSDCGAGFTDARAAVTHQLGERQVRLLTSIHGFSQEPWQALARAAAQRNPARWVWSDLVAPTKT